MLQIPKAIFLHKLFGFNITSEAIVGPILMLGTRWFVNNNLNTLLPGISLSDSLADFLTVMTYILFCL